MKVKKIGVIGAGSITTKTHIPLYKALNLEVVWVLDFDRSRAHDVSKSFRIPHAFGVEDLSGTPPVDMVLLACPYGSRTHYYEHLRSSNEAIYVEKPFARSVNEWEMICALRPPNAIAAGFLRRSMGITGLLKSIVLDGLFGSLRQIRSDFGTATVISSGAAFAKNLRLAGGGQLFESAIHNIDTVCQIVDAQSAEFISGRMDHEKGFDLHTEARLKLITSEQKEIDFDLLVTCFQNTRYELEFKFDHAVVTCSLFRRGPVQVMVERGGRSYEISDSEFGRTPDGPYDVSYIFLKDFFKALESGVVNYTNACATRVTAQIMELLYAMAGVNGSI